MAVKFYGMDPIFLLNFTPIILLFLPFAFFCKKHEEEFFDQRLVCSATKCWSKFTTVGGSGEGLDLSVNSEVPP